MKIIKSYANVIKWKIHNFLVFASMSRGTQLLHVFLKYLAIYIYIFLSILPLRYRFFFHFVKEDYSTHILIQIGFFLCAYTNVNYSQLNKSYKYMFVQIFFLHTYNAAYMLLLAHSNIDFWSIETIKNCRTEKMDSKHSWVYVCMFKKYRILLYAYICIVYSCFLLSVQKYMRVESRSLKSLSSNTWTYTVMYKYIGTYELGNRQGYLLLLRLYYIKDIII